MVFSKSFFAAIDSDGNPGILVGISPEKYPLAEDVLFITANDGKIRTAVFGSCVVRRDGETVSLEGESGEITFRLADELPGILSEEAEKISELLERRHFRPVIMTGPRAARYDELCRRLEALQKQLGYIDEDGMYLTDPEEAEYIIGMDGFRVATKEELKKREDTENAYPELRREMFYLQRVLDALRGARIA